MSLRKVRPLKQAISQKKIGDSIPNITLFSISKI